MQIRAITAFTDISLDLDAGHLARVADAARATRQALEDAGFTVQSLRLATQPVSDLLPSGRADELPALAVRYETAFKAAGFSYGALGAIDARTAPALVDTLPDALAATDGAFFSVQVGDAQGVNEASLRRTAEAVLAASRLDAHGFANLRLTAHAAVPALVPFFPAASHTGGPARLALALETADEWVAATQDSVGPDVAVTRAAARLTQVAALVAEAASRAATAHGVTFIGSDFSTATYPTPDRSIATAIERLSGAPFGQPGTLRAAARITTALHSLAIQRAGFCGLMLPLLEDAVLARRYAEGAYTLDTLLALSTVCGTGLDTVPLPGDIPVDRLAGLIGDVAALAVRLNKPLTARLMPVPGATAGAMTTFDFPYFANTRIR